MFGKKKEQRFEVKEQQVTPGRIIDVIKDRETGALYLHIVNGGLTPLNGPDGKQIFDPIND